MQRQIGTAEHLQVLILQRYMQHPGAHIPANGFPIGFQRFATPDKDGCNWTATAPIDIDEPAAFAEAVQRVRMEWNLEIPFLGASAAPLR